MLTTCTKKVYVVEEPVDPAINLSPGNFEIQIGKITDKSISLNWSIPTDPDLDQLSYEVAVDDSVVAYDLKQNSFNIGNLNSDRNYSISVIALDIHRNKSRVNKTTRTMKSFIENVISYDYGNISYYFDTVLETSDNGYLIYGYSIETGLNGKAVLMRLASDYSIVWKQEREREGDNIFACQMIECSNHDFIIIRSGTILRIDSQGNTLWSYVNNEKGILSFKSVIEDKNGDLFLSGLGEYVSMPGEIRHSGEYFVMKLAADGTKLFQKISQTNKINRIQQIKLYKNNLLLFGTIDNYLSISVLNIDGNIISTKTFLNKYKCVDLPHSFFITPDNNYLLLSTAAGPIGNYGYSNNIPRFLKVREDGAVIWDQYHYLVSGGVFPYINCFTILGNGQYLTVIHDDRGSSIVILNSQGDVEKQVKLPGFPGGPLIKYNTKGKYEFLTFSGRIVIINPDGYVE